MTHRISPLLPGLIFIVFLLFSGLLGGLARLGWPLPSPVTMIAGLHGPLMICGFLGTLIGIERAFAGGHRWGYAAPLLCAGGVLALLLGLPIPAGASLILAAAGVQIALLSLQFGSKSQSLPLLVQILGLICWSTGSLFWLLGRPFAEIALWWAGFLLLTIAGGRMAKFVPAGTGQSFAAAALVFAGGLLLATHYPNPGLRVSALGLFGCSLWLQVYDPACRFKDAPAGERFMAVCLRLGYAWLTAASALLMMGTQALEGFWYDITLHSLFVGFVFAVILGHLPRMLPMLLGKSAVHHPLFYFWLLLLQASLLLRLAGGCLGTPALRAWGGLLNVVALVGFLMMVLCLLFCQRCKTPSGSDSLSA